VNTKKHPVKPYLSLSRYLLIIDMGLFVGTYVSDRITDLLT